MMTDIAKVKIWKVMGASNHFWVVTLVAYFQWRGLSTSEALSLVSLYSILVVVLEYPTGVIGDYFSHRTSVLIGSLLMSLGYFFLSFSASYVAYAAMVFVASLAVSLISGSDTAFLHAVSKDFKRDLAQITPYALTLSAISITVGGLAASIDMRLPLYLSFAYGVASLPFLFGYSEYKHTREEGNIFSAATLGIKDVVTNGRLRNLMVISNVFGAFFVSIKWFYNPLFESLSLPISVWGVVTSVAFLLVAVGAQIYKKSDKIDLSYTSFLTLVSVVLVGVTNIKFIPILAVWFLHILRGYQDTYLGVAMNESISTNRRASILSLNSLLGRLLSAGYIVGAGYLLSVSSFFVVFAATAVVIAFLVVKPLVSLKG